MKRVVDEVVAGEDDLALAHRTAGDALVCGDRRLALRPLDRQVDRRVPERPVQPATLDDELDPSAVGVEQPHGLVERSLEDVAGIVDGRDPGGDLAERSLRLDPVLELLVEPRVAEHDRCLARQRAEQLGRVLGEGVGARRVGADRADAVPPPR